MSIHHVFGSPTRYHGSRRVRSPYQRLRRLIVEFLEQRTPLSVSPIVPTMPAPAVAQPSPQASSLPPASGQSGSNAAPISADSAQQPASSTGSASGGSQASGAAAVSPTTSANGQGDQSQPAAANATGGSDSTSSLGRPNAPPAVISLLFDPHQPRSSVPADVTFADGPPLQQGAPPRFSYNLEDNITGGSHLGPEAMIVAAHGTDIAGPFVSNQQAYVASTPQGIPNFSFGPDTWVFGPQQASSGARSMQNSPARGQGGNGSGQLPSGQNPLQQGAEERSNRSSAIEGAASPDVELAEWQSALSEPSATSSPPAESARFENVAVHERAIWMVFADHAFLDDLMFAGGERLADSVHSKAAPDDDEAAPEPKRLMAAEPLNAPRDERVPVFARALSAASLFVPAAIKERERRRQPTDMRGWSQPVKRVRGDEASRPGARRFPGSHILKE